MGHLDRLSRKGWAPSWSRAAGRAACVLAAVVRHAVLCRSDSREPELRCCVGSTLCEQPEIGLRRRVCLFPSRNVTKV